MPISGKKGQMTRMINSGLNPQNGLNQQALIENQLVGYEQKITGNIVPSNLLASSDNPTDGKLGMHYNSRVPTNKAINARVEALDRRVHSIENIIAPGVVNQWDSKTGIIPKSSIDSSLNSNKNTLYVNSTAHLGTETGSFTSPYGTLAAAIAAAGAGDTIEIQDDATYNGHFVVNVAGLTINGPKAILTSDGVTVLFTSSGTLNVNRVISTGAATNTIAVVGDGLTVKLNVEYVEVVGGTGISGTGAGTSVICDKVGTIFVGAAGYGIGNSNAGLQNATFYGNVNRIAAVGALAYGVYFASSGPVIEQLTVNVIEEVGAGSFQRALNVDGSINCQLTIGSASSSLVLLNTAGGAQVYINATYLSGTNLVSTNNIVDVVKIYTSYSFGSKSGPGFILVRIPNEMGSYVAADTAELNDIIDDGLITDITLRNSTTYTIEDNHTGVSGVIIRSEQPDGDASGYAAILDFVWTGGHGGSYTFYYGFTLIGVVVRFTYDNTLAAAARAITLSTGGWGGDGNPPMNYFINCVFIFSGVSTPVANTATMVYGSGSASFNGCSCVLNQDSLPLPAALTERQDNIINLTGGDLIINSFEITGGDNDRYRDSNLINLTNGVATFTNIYYSGLSGIVIVGPTGNAGVAPINLGSTGMGNQAFHRIINCNMSVISSDNLFCSGNHIAVGQYIDVAGTETNTSAYIECTGEKLHIEDCFISNYILSTALDVVIKNVTVGAGSILTYFGLPYVTGGRGYAVHITGANKVLVDGLTTTLSNITNPPYTAAQTELHVKIDSVNATINQLSCAHAFLPGVTGNLAINQATCSGTVPYVVATENYGYYQTLVPLVVNLINITSRGVNLAGTVVSFTNLNATFVVASSVSGDLNGTGLELTGVIAGDVHVVAPYNYSFYASNGALIANITDINAPQGFYISASASYINELSGTFIIGAGASFSLKSSVLVPVIASRCINLIDGLPYDFGVYSSATTTILEDVTGGGGVYPGIEVVGTNLQTKGEISTGTYFIIACSGRINLGGHIRASGATTIPYLGATPISIYISGQLWTRTICTFTNGTDTTNAPGHTLVDTNRFMYSVDGAAGTIPGELELYTSYYARDVVAGVSFKTAATSGGAAIPFGDDGAAITYITPLVTNNNGLVAEDITAEAGSVIISDCINMKVTAKTLNGGVGLVATCSGKLNNFELKATHATLIKLFNESALRVPVQTVSRVILGASFSCSGIQINNGTFLLDAGAPLDGMNLAGLRIFMVNSLCAGVTPANAGVYEIAFGQYSSASNNYLYNKEAGANRTLTMPITETSACCNLVYDIGVVAAETTANNTSVA